MTKKRLIILVGVTAVAVVAAVALTTRRSEPVPPPPSSPAASLLPSAAISDTKIAELPSTLDRPFITPKGDLVFATHRNTALGTMRAGSQRFELLTGQQFRYIESVDWSPSGRRAIVHDAQKTYLFRGVRDVGEFSATDGAASWSPDEQRLVYADSKTHDTRVYDLEAQRSRRLAGQTGNKFVWSPNGTTIAAFNAEGKHSLKLVAASGQVKDTGIQSVVAASWSPDAKRLLVTKNAEGKPELSVLTVADGQEEKVDLMGIADHAAWLDSSEFWLASAGQYPEGYLDDPDPRSDGLWQVHLGEAPQELSEFEGQVQAIRLIGKKLHAVTQSRLYTIDLTGAIDG